MMCIKLLLKIIFQHSFTYSIPKIIEKGFMLVNNKKKIFSYLFMLIYITILLPSTLIIIHIKIT